MTDTLFLLTAHAVEFVSRDIGRHVRDQLLAFELKVPPAEQITIDATGVSLLTPSFVDEFFGRTASVFGLERFRVRFRIVGIEGETKLLINKVVRNRLILDRSHRSENELHAVPDGVPAD